MPAHEVPQPSPDRMVPLRGHPLVVGVTPHQPELVLLTAAAWAAAVGVASLYCAYVDGSRFVSEEYPDGTVLHDAVDPDGVDDEWRWAVVNALGTLALCLAAAAAGDRALTHLARAVDAAGFVVGTSAPGAGARLREFVEGSVAVRLTHHQHRPVLVVPLRVVDWHAHPLLSERS